MDNLPAKPEDVANSFWDNMSTSDFAIPRVKLDQKKNLGKFVFNTGGVVNQFDSAKLIVPTKTRVLYSGNAAARCSSDNFYVPSTRIKNPCSTSCLSCPLAQWGENDMKYAIAQEIGEDVADFNKPMCAETYCLLMADKENKLFFVSFQKTQLKIVQEKLFSRLRYEFGKLPPFHVAFDMSSFITKTGKTEYANVSFDNFKPVDDKDKALLTDLYSSWKTNAQTILAKQHEQMDTEHIKQAQAAPPEMSDDEIPF